MSGYYWYGDNPNCGRCGHLNSRGFCDMTACIYPVMPQTAIYKPQKQTNFVYDPIRTNYDRIISKTPEELAKFISENVECFATCPARRDRCGYSDNCRKAWLDWLRQEAEAALKGETQDA